MVIQTLDQVHRAFAIDFHNLPRLWLARSIAGRVFGLRLLLFGFLQLLEFWIARDLAMSVDTHAEGGRLDGCSDYGETVGVVFEVFLLLGADFTSKGTHAVL